MTKISKSNTTYQDGNTHGDKIRLWLNEFWSKEDNKMLYIIEFDNTGETIYVLSDTEEGAIKKALSGGNEHNVIGNVIAHVYYK